MRRRSCGGRERRAVSVSGSSGRPKNDVGGQRGSIGAKTAAAGERPLPRERWGCEAAGGKGAGLKRRANSWRISSRARVPPAESESAGQGISPERYKQIRRARGVASPDKGRSPECPRAQQRGYSGERPSDEQSGSRRASGQGTFARLLPRSARSEKGDATPRQRPPCAVALGLASARSGALSPAPFRALPACWLLLLRASASVPMGAQSRSSEQAGCRAPDPSS